mmetsp:Transcript_49797/g.126579  ORF Transcript_49797/g.126579 Transcript_49797/m.126579 type:complete len:291 (-) Transcript_49797:140-1012(-)
MKGACLTLCWGLEGRKSPSEIARSGVAGDIPHLTVHRSSGCLVDVEVLHVVGARARHRLLGLRVAERLADKHVDEVLANLLGHGTGQAGRLRLGVVDGVVIRADLSHFHLEALCLLALLLPIRRSAQFYWHAVAAARWRVIDRARDLLAMLLVAVQEGAALARCHLSEERPAVVGHVVLGADGMLGGEVLDLILHRARTLVHGLVVPRRLGKLAGLPHLPLFVGHVLARARILARLLDDLVDAAGVLSVVLRGEAHQDPLREAGVALSMAGQMVVLRTKDWLRGARLHVG